LPVLVFEGLLVEVGLKKFQIARQQIIALGASVFDTMGGEGPEECLPRVRGLLLNLYVDIFPF
jgi:hypothetical protein